MVTDALFDPVVFTVTVPVREPLPVFAVRVTVASPFPVPLDVPEIPVPDVEVFQAHESALTVTGTGSV
jgi:hypothetical protein